MFVEWRKRKEWEGEKVVNTVGRKHVPIDCCNEKRVLVAKHAEGGESQPWDIIEESTVRRQKAKRDGRSCISGVIFDSHRM
jgi:hypothetical protein